MGLVCSKSILTSKKTSSTEYLCSGRVERAATDDDVVEASPGVTPVDEAAEPPSQSR